jgi:hypothetical protein
LVLSKHGGDDGSFVRVWGHKASVQSLGEDWREIIHVLGKKGTKCCYDVMENSRNKNQRKKIDG